MTNNDNTLTTRQPKATNHDVRGAGENGTGRYFFVNGLGLYYEIHGESHGTDKPLVLLVGGLTTIDITFGAVLATLAKSRRIIAVEQQGHGHTADIDRPMSFPRMADDTAALLRHLQIDQADLFGHSDGGNVGLGIAIRHPELVRKLVVAGTNYNNDGLAAGILESFKSVGPDDADMGHLKAAYLKVAPRPEDWPTMVRKVMQMALIFPGWQPNYLKAIRAHTLIMIGDADVIRPEHAVEMFHLIPQSQLAVLPGTDHRLPKTRPDWLLPMLADFLDAPMPLAA
ncbi:alpha/beta fold hydrolase [Spirosoma arcticum]